MIAVRWESYTYMCAHMHALMHAYSHECTLDYFSLRSVTRARSSDPNFISGRGQWEYGYGGYSDSDMSVTGFNKASRKSKQHKQNSHWLSLPSTSEDPLVPISNVLNRTKILINEYTIQEN